MLDNRIPQVRFRQQEEEDDEYIPVPEQLSDDKIFAEDSIKDPYLEGLKKGRNPESRMDNLIDLETRAQVENLISNGKIREEEESLRQVDVKDVWNLECGMLMSTIALLVSPSDLNLFTVNF